MTKSRVTPLAVMAGVLVLASVLDRITAVVKNFMAQTFLTHQGFAWLTLLEFIFAGMAILLVWLTLARSRRSVLVGTIFVVVGLIFLLYSTFFRFSLSTMIPNPYNGLFRYQLQDLPFFQRIIATLVWNMGHSSFWRSAFAPPASFQFFTQASVLITLLGVIKFFQKPRQASPTI